ncbi:uncharacterized protein LOC133386061 [Rhineura floridana]|uniref:uncharacterized protein LOC133386061 n=1 Tax=Rhineura floridana TaxID=261503 RepID=UPI002AC830C2|nr:uncharacterized protein LOC133386061 [Rhineura floridana]
MGFQRCVADPCVYIKQGKDISYCLVYVDDILYMHNNEREEQECASGLKRYMQTKCLGPVQEYLGMHVIHDNNGGFILHQGSKIEQLLADSKMADCNEMKTPMSVSFQNETEGDYFTDPDLYRQIIGKLQYLAKVTRPDIANAVSILCRKVDKPTEKDWRGVKRVVRYLKGTVNYGLALSAVATGNLACYVDADHAGDKNNRKSTAGVLIMFHGYTIDWFSRKQTLVATSSTEAEYISLSMACHKLNWYELLMEEAQIKIQKPIRVYEDNQSCIRLAESEANNRRTKHVSVRFHHVRDCVQSKLIKLIYVNTKDADAC